MRSPTIFDRVYDATILPAWKLYKRLFMRRPTIVEGQLKWQRHVMMELAKDLQDENEREARRMQKLSWL